MKIRSPFLYDLAALSAAMGIRAWMHTIETKAAYYDPLVDPAHPRCTGQRLYLFWHEYILLPLYFRGNCNLSMLISKHQDAEILSRTARLMGFDTIRGSTGRGGTTALREMLRKSAEMNLTMVPDGPRGPRRVLAPGAIFVASKLGLPIVPLGLGCDTPWRAKSWDRFVVPRPFSRARAVVGPELVLPPDLDRDGIEHYRRHVETLLNRLTLEAEAWAEAGTPKVDEQPVSRRPGSVQIDRTSAASETQRATAMLASQTADAIAEEFPAEPLIRAA